MANTAPVSKPKYELPKQGGLKHAVCCDFVDLGMKTETYQGETKTRHMCRMYWQIDELGADGKRLVVSKRYTFSMHEKATLRKDCSGWRGRPFTDAEAAAFDFDKVLGANCMLNVVLNSREGSTYCDVVSIAPPMKQLPKLTIDPTYVRMKDRPKDQKPAAQQPQRYDTAPPPSDDDPFSSARETVVDVGDEQPLGQPVDQVRAPDDDDIPF